jgi:hypothetical protein
VEESIMTTTLTPEAHAALSAELKALQEVNRLYVHLIHGRKDPDEQPEDWGFNGPTQGPFEWVHITYLTHMRCGRADGSEVEFKFHEDMLEHEGSYYGDFEITTKP